MAFGMDAKPAPLKDPQQELKKLLEKASTHTNMVRARGGREAAEMLFINDGASSDELSRIERPGAKL